MIKVAQFMKKHGMDAERIDLAEYTKAFAGAMRSGIGAFQKEMPMLPTYLYSSGKLQKGGRAVVIGAGGTNFPSPERTSLRNGTSSSPALPTACSR